MSDLKRMVLLLALGLPLAGCGSDEAIDLGPGGDLPIDDYALVEPVDVIIDDRGAPHMYAQSDLDLFFAMGHQQATDRLFQMEVNRRSALGRLAELLGEAGLETDQQARAFEFARFGAESAQAMKEQRPADYNLVVAFAAGINRRIDDIQAQKAAAPSELAEYGGEAALEHWDAGQVLAIGVRIQFGFSSTLAFDLLNTLLNKLTPVGGDLPVFQPGGATFFMAPDMTSKSTAALPAFTPPSGSRPDISAAELSEMLRGIDRLATVHGVGEGSNGWVVRGDFSENGRPFFANDSHAGLRAPNAMHLSHINSAAAGGNFDAIGYSFVGVPGVQVGHNRHIVWGATTNFADMQDIWAVEVADGMATLGNEEYAVETRTERIQVRQADGELREETLEVSKIPGQGVFLPDEVLPVPGSLISDRKLLLGWPGFVGTPELGGFFDYNRATDLDEFEVAVQEQRTGMQNWQAASADGIRLRVSGLVPDRGPVKGRPRANTVLDGSDPNDLWTGEFLDASRLPRLDESRRFIVTANNDPWGHTADNDPLNDEFYYGSFFSPGFRAQRLTAELNRLMDAGTISREQHEQLQMNVSSSLADGLLPLLDAAVTAIDTSAELESFRGRDDLKDAADQLGKWDRRMTRDSTAAALFRVWLSALERRTLATPLGLLFVGLDDAQPVTMAKFTFLAHTKRIQALLGDGQDVILIDALADALAHIERLKQEQTKTDITWGDIHRARFRSADFKDELVPSDGGDSSPNVAQSRCLTDTGIADQCVSSAGAVYRLVVGFDEDGVPNATYNWPKGDRQQLDDWLEGDFKPLLYRRADVDAATASESVLRPR